MKKNHIEVVFMISSRWNVFLAFLLLLLLSNCNIALEEGTGNRSVINDGSNSQTTITSSNFNNTTTFSNLSSSLFWFTAGQTIEGTVTLNENNQTGLFLRGNLIQNFLLASDNNLKTFCLVVSFNIGTAGAKKQLRMRASPLIFNNFQTNSLERLFRLDPILESTNTTVCSGTAFTITDADSAFALNTLCPNCVSTETATQIKLFEATSAGLSTQIPDNTLNLASLGIVVDFSSASTSPVTSCTNTECVAQGFDCCLNGQCIKNGELKPDASTNSLFSQAQSDVASNPAAILNYPEIYHVCPGTAFPDAPTAALPDLVQESLDRLAQETKEYNCLQDINTCAANGLNQATLKETIRTRCGCNADPNAAPPNDPASVCPEFTLAPVTLNNEIVRFECQVVADPNSSLTAEESNQTITVEGRMAPHRFFKSDGTLVDDITTIANTTDTQEGTAFLYLDPVNFTSPSNGTFNMNSILGQFDVSLTKAKPAKKVTVKLDQTYIITTLSGSYNPCIGCLPDSWVNALSAFPTSLNGTGAKASGHTTTRQTTVSNFSGGNYEDTLFNRACFLPPTMIPFSHSSNANLQTQRLNRLKTQAAYFVNGYQKDWFGFNRGALIGSFDGVTWFAVGNGRRVKATSTKLYLALNAPMADLASNTETVVTVIPDSGSNIVSDFDFDPNFSVNDPRQNMAGSCQRYHQCTTDSDCITQLGWEYMCADISRYKTLWPTFDSDGNETVNAQTSLSGGEILQGKTLPSGSVNRCVYRGAGSPCKKKFTSLNIDTRKLFTCAPNFYCASLTEDFNKEMARSLLNFENILFGQEFDMPGRPKTYLGGDTKFTSDITTNMNANASNMDSTFTTDADMGICRPGKLLSDPDPIDQMASKDTSNRTDYISQLASCDSTATGTSRTQTCPVLDTTGNYTHITNGTHDTAEALRQNSCGAESQSSSGSSAFSSIEGAVLTTTSLAILTPTLAKDACFRRAGNVCQTNLDCTPNNLHAEQATFLGTNFFGGNLAEQEYWQQDLVCGQEDSKPFLGASTFSTFDLTKNRCCREIGKTLTLATAGDPAKLTDNPSLSANTLPSTDPKATGRYSRYAIIKDLGVTHPSNPYNEVPLVNTNTPATATLPNKFQWMTLRETANKTCCGGGWIRNFSDNSHDWTIINRLNIDVSNFECLNYKNDLSTTRPDEILSSIYTGEYFKLCFDPNNNGCIQIPFATHVSFTPTNPSDPGVADGTNPNLNTHTFAASVDVPYSPTPAPFDAGDPLDNAARPLDLKVNAGFTVAKFYLPIYINGRFNIQQVDFLNDTDANGTIDTTSTNVSFGVGGGEFWNVSSGIFTWGNTGAFTGNIYARVTFRPAGSQDYRYEGNNDGSTDTTREGLLPGNDIYYLLRFGKMELLGIPQITYEPLYCHSDRSKLVPGLYSVSTRTNFEAATTSFTNSNLDATDTMNPSQKVVTNQFMTPADVFSSDQFTCCRHLGETVSVASECCSNFTVDVTTSGVTTKVCKLPTGTNLNVYFNRFVSSDGEGSTQPGGGLVNTDFNAFTGEPLSDDSVNTKIKQLGQEYCQTGTVLFGGAFGTFKAQPASPTGALSFKNIFRINYLIDDKVEENTTTNTPPSGTETFNAGPKWNHHLYCFPTNITN